MRPAVGGLIGPHLPRGRPALQPRGSVHQRAEHRVRRLSAAAHRPEVGLARRHTGADLGSRSPARLPPRLLDQRPCA